MLSAFDSDVLIYAGSPEHALSGRILSAIDDGPAFGSVLLLVEVLSKPARDDPESVGTKALVNILSRITLRPFDESTARLALSLAVSYRLRAADAMHLATAVAEGADRFITNNRKDFPKAIDEIEVVYPDELPEPVA